MSTELPADARAAWVRRRVETSYAHLSEAQFAKGFDTAENEECVARFLDDAAVGVLVFSDKLVASHTLGQRMRSGHRMHPWVAPTR